MAKKRPKTGKVQRNGDGPCRMTKAQEIATRAFVRRFIAMISAANKQRGPQ